MLSFGIHYNTTTLHRTTLDIWVIGDAVLNLERYAILFLPIRCRPRASNNNSSHHNSYFHPSCSSFTSYLAHKHHIASPYSFNLYHL